MDTNTYEYRYTLATGDPNEPSLMVAWQAILTPEVATGVLFGLQQTTTVTDATCHEYSTVSTPFHGVPGAVRGQ